MKPPERIWIDTIRGADGFLLVGGADLPRDEASRSVGCYILDTPEALAKSDTVKALVKADADLLLDAYKALLVLHRLLDKSGLSVGAETASNIADRIVAAHPEIPARSALRTSAIRAVVPK